MCSRLLPWAGSSVVMAGPLVNQFVCFLSRACASTLLGAPAEATNLGDGSV
jgi:hypothetical protein